MPVVQPKIMTAAPRSACPSTVLQPHEVPVLQPFNPCNPDSGAAKCLSFNLRTLEAPVLHPRSACPSTPEMPVLQPPKCLSFNPSFNPSSLERGIVRTQKGCTPTSVRQLLSRRGLTGGAIGREQLESGEWWLPDLAQKLEDYLRQVSRLGPSRQGSCTKGSAGRTVGGLGRSPRVPEARDRRQQQGRGPRILCRRSTGFQPHASGLPGRMATYNPASGSVCIAAFTCALFWVPGDL